MALLGYLFLCALLITGSPWAMAAGADPADSRSGGATAPAGKEKEVNEDELVIVHVPALVAVLAHLENEKGSPLTEAEVLSATDEANAMVMPKSAQRAIEKSRGYTDIDPENAWEEWLAFKETRE